MSHHKQANNQGIPSNWVDYCKQSAAWTDGFRSAVEKAAAKSHNGGGNNNNEQLQSILKQIDSGVCGHAVGKKKDSVYPNPVNPKPNQNPENPNPVIPNSVNLKPGNVIESGAASASGGSSESGSFLDSIWTDDSNRPWLVVGAVLLGLVLLLSVGCGVLYAVKRKTKRNTKHSSSSTRRNRRGRRTMKKQKKVVAANRNTNALSHTTTTYNTDNFKKNTSTRKRNLARRMGRTSLAPTTLGRQTMHPKRSRQHNHK